MCLAINKSLIVSSGSSTRILFQPIVGQVEHNHFWHLLNCTLFLGFFFMFINTESLSSSVLESSVFLSHFSLEYCEKYAKPEDAGVIPEDKSSDEELSEDENGSGDEEIMGKPDP
jgi:hypothetical protein